MSRENILQILSHLSVEMAQINDSLVPLIDNAEKALNSRYANYNIEDIVTELANIRQSIFAISCDIDEYKRKKFEE